MPHRNSSVACIEENRRPPGSGRKLSSLALDHLTQMFLADINETDLYWCSCSKYRNGQNMCRVLDTRATFVTFI